MGSHAGLVLGAWCPVLGVEKPEKRVERDSCSCCCFLASDLDRFRFRLDLKLDLE